MISYTENSPVLFIFNYNYKNIDILLIRKLLVSLLLWGGQMHCSYIEKESTSNSTTVRSNELLLPGF